MSEVNYTSPTERVETWLDQTTLHIQFNNVAKHNALSVDHVGGRTAFTDSSRIRPTS